MILFTNLHKFKTLFYNHLKHLKLYFICTSYTLCLVASVMSNSVQLHRLQPTRLLCPWDFPGKNTGVGCHFLLHPILYTLHDLGFPGAPEGKESACNVGDLGIIPASGITLEKRMATHSSILAWRILWTKEPGGQWSMVSQLTTAQHIHDLGILYIYT